MQGIMGEIMKDWAVEMRRGFREGFREEVTPELGKSAGHIPGKSRR